MCLIDIEKAFDSVWRNRLICKLVKKEFTEELIILINNMIRGRSFQTSGLNKLSRITGVISNGLQEGAINSPHLFNIANSDLLYLFGLNKNEEKDSVQKYAIAFADDLNVIVVSKDIKKINESLTDISTKINKYYLNYNLKSNASKCETTLIRRPQTYLSAIDKKNEKEFKVIITDLDGTEHEIPHKKVVKYLGFYIDYLYRLNK